MGLSIWNYIAMIVWGVPWFSLYLHFGVRENETTECATRNELRHWWQMFKYPKNAVFGRRGWIFETENNKVQKRLSIKQVSNAQPLFVKKNLIGDLHAWHSE